MPTDNEALHERIREAYVQERRIFEYRVSGAISTYGNKHIPKWDGTDHAVRDRYGRNYKPVWPKIAQFAFKAGVDPIELIKSRFRETRGPRPPEPTDCMCKAALELCLLSDISVDETNRNLYQMIEVFQTEVENRSVYIERYGWSAFQVVESVVKDLTLNLNPLYRYYLARVNGLDLLADQHRDAAIVEYMRHPKAYDCSDWVKVIPSEIVNQAKLSVV
jgi:hypothetical protein